MPNVVVRATIAAGASLSNGVDLGPDSGRLGLHMPSAWTAAGITFQVSESDQGPWGNLYDDAGAEVGLTSANVTASRAISLATPQLREALAPWRFLKVRSGVSATPVNQVAAAAIVISTEH